MDEDLLGGLLGRMVGLVEVGGFVGLAVAFDELAVFEAGVGADQGDQIGARFFAPGWADFGSAASAPAIL